uniref:(California timema) hypothetical protein n=1 Tax=Timema californicum TaxID=61474 RepID=A0A7R9J6W4_TIMCA|nr:unnamed protein product [Timema californicum]
MLTNRRVLPAPGLSCVPWISQGAGCGGGLEGEGLGQDIVEGCDQRSQGAGCGGGLEGEGSCQDMVEADYVVSAWSSRPVIPGGLGEPTPKPPRAPLSTTQSYVRYCLKAISQALVNVLGQVVGCRCRANEPKTDRHTDPVVENQKSIMGKKEEEGTITLAWAGDVTYSNQGSDRRTEHPPPSVDLIASESQVQFRTSTMRYSLLLLLVTSVITFSVLKLLHVTLFPYFVVNLSLGLLTVVLADLLVKLAANVLPRKLLPDLENKALSLRPLALSSASLKPILWDDGREGERRGFTTTQSILPHQQEQIDHGKLVATRQSTPPPPENTTTTTSSLEVSVLPIPDVINTAPVQARKKAELLLEHIILRGGISWDENGEVSIHDAPLHGSNIVDLINCLLRSRRHSKPSGWRELFTALLKINVPKEFIINLKRLVPIIDPTPVPQVLTLSQRPKKKKLKRGDENRWLSFRA